MSVHIDSSVSTERSRVCVQKRQWEVALLVVLKAVSFAVVPTLQPALESRESIELISSALSTRGLTEDHFACLIEVLCPDE